jgi:uncharacterized membrane protein YuzA (DUF378 family)
MKGLHGIAFFLVIIGGLNWGLMAIGYFIGASDWNVVNLALGTWPVVENIVYLLVGLSALSVGISHRKECRTCNPSGM